MVAMSDGDALRIRCRSETKKKQSRARRSRHDRASCAGSRQHEVKKNTHKGDQQQLKSFMCSDVVILLVAFNEEAMVQVMHEMKIMLHGIKFEYMSTQTKEKKKKKTCPGVRVGVWVCGPDSADTCISGRDPLLRGATKVTLGQYSPGRCDSWGGQCLRETKNRENLKECGDYKRPFDLLSETGGTVIR
ncbi:hypothetical protein E2C01_000620 [Portunus trituberculatus]|uniref:Uncharacterized protein n=1 Tax=Portunus trituberculatus TaxID=210409 RepID=A0A5B7CFK5_PORTR|nr:hypothetical protein [Portunus trituberculatus]